MRRRIRVFTSAKRCQKATIFLALLGRSGPPGLGNIREEGLENPLAQHPHDDKERVLRGTELSHLLTSASDSEPRCETHPIVRNSPSAVDEEPHQQLDHVNRQENMLQPLKRQWPT